MDNYELQKLRDLPIEGVAERLGLQVTRHRCLCPFHDDHHPSMSFSAKRNTYRCWSCGASGDVIDLVMNYLHKPFLEATKWLGLSPDPSPVGRGKDLTGSLRATGSSPSGGGWEGAFYERFFARPWLSDEARRFLFDERRLDPRVVRWCRLTSWRDKQGVPWLQTPYYDREGKLIGVQNRNLSLTPVPSPSGEGSKYTKDRNVAEKEITPLARLRAAGGEAPRFRFPRGSECSIYNLPVLNMLKPGEALYITEGCSDCWAMLSAGHKAIAIPSATLLSRKDVELLSTLNTQLSTEFHMYPDNDLPGERLFLQLQQVLPSLQHHQLPTGCKDFSDYYLQHIFNLKC